MCSGVRTVAILGTLESYYRDIPTTTFSNYESKVHFLPNQRGLDFYQMVAQKLAELYMNSLRSPVYEFAREFPSKIDDDKIMKFGHLLKEYIITTLSAKKMVSLETKKIPKGELQRLLQSCDIDLISEEKKHVFFLPYRCKVFLDPYFPADADSPCEEGLHISIRRL